jgi:transposase
MSILMVSVGLDYHQDFIRLSVLDPQGRQLFNRDCPNCVEAVGEKVLEFGWPQAIAIEACCGAADFAERLAQRYNWNVRLAHPGYVRRLKQSPDKSDHDDAWLLADLVRVDYLPEVWLAPEPTRRLRRLVRYRQQLKRARTDLKLQLRGLLREERVLHAPANPWTQAWLQWLREAAALSPEGKWIVERQLLRLEQLNQEIAEVERRFQEATADDPVTQKLLQQTGVGLVTAVTLRAEIGRFERFRTGKQLARYCGVTPCNASSGQRQADAGLVKAGNRELRTILLETAHRLTRYDERWAALKRRLVQKKPASVAVAAVANRWIRWLHHHMTTTALDGAGQPAGKDSSSGSPAAGAALPGLLVACVP